ncbi:MAG: hypothetical protein RL385_2446 [Pseudomonadota bacterium]
MTTKATFIEQLANVSEQIEREWPAWMTEMRSQAHHAEDYLRQQERGSRSSSATRPKDR